MCWQRPWCSAMWSLRIHGARQRCSGELSGRLHPMACCQNHYKSMANAEDLRDRPALYIFCMYIREGRRLASQSACLTSHTCSKMCTKLSAPSDICANCVLISELHCRSDLIPVILVLVLGTSNGHLASLASMHMPSLLPHHYRYAASALI